MTKQEGGDPELLNPPSAALQGKGELDTGYFHNGQNTVGTEQNTHSQRVKQTITQAGQALAHRCY